MKLLGVDYGARRVGLAIADIESKLAMPLFVIENNKDFWQRFLKIINEEAIEAIVVGWPVSLNESDAFGETSLEIESFINELGKFISMPIYKEDERFSSDLAKRLTGEKGKKRDDVAASIILQSYIDRKN